MRHVHHFVAVTESDDVGEVVLDDAQMVAVIADVRREQQSVAPTEDALLALIGRAPENLQPEFIGLDDLGRFGETLT